MLNQKKPREVLDLNHTPSGCKCKSCQIMDTLPEQMTPSDVLKFMFHFFKAYELDPFDMLDIGYETAKALEAEARRKFLEDQLTKSIQEVFDTAKPRTN